MQKTAWQWLDPWFEALTMNGPSITVAGGAGWLATALAGGVLVVLNAAVELGLYWLRWLFCAVLAGRDEDECRSRNRTHVLYCPHAWEGGHGSCVVLRVVRVGAAARVGPSAACGGDGCLNRPRG